MITIISVEEDLWERLSKDDRDFLRLTLKGTFASLGIWSDCHMFSKLEEAAGDAPDVLIQVILEDEKEKQALVEEGVERLIQYRLGRRTYWPQPLLNELSWGVKILICTESKYTKYND